MKFRKNDVVRRILPSGTEVGGLMVAITSTHGKCTAVRDAVTNKVCMYRSSSLEKVGETTKIMVSKEDMRKIECTKGIGVFYHNISKVYDKLYISHKLYANKPRFVCFVLANKGATIRRTYQLGSISRVLRKVGEIQKGYEIVPVKQPMYKIQLIGEL